MLWSSTNYTPTGVLTSQDCERGVLRDLVLKLKPILYLPGEYVCEKGDVGKEMYMISQGVLEVVGGENNQTVFVTLHEGTVFGEISILGINGCNRRTATVRSKGFSNLFILDKEDVQETLCDYPAARKILLNKARKMVSKDTNDKKTLTKNDFDTEMIEICRL